MRRNTCRSGGRRCRSCAGRRGAVCSTPSTHHPQAACGGGRSTSGCCATDVKRSHCWAGWSGEPSSPAVRLWLEFGAKPVGRNWYRAHNASIVGAYLEYQERAEAESAPERFFMNVALARVLYAHALNAAPRLALGRLAALGRVSATRGSGWRASFSPCIACYPPVIHSRSSVGELHRRRTTSRATARLRSARPSAAAAVRVVGPMSSPSPRLLQLVRDGNPIYAWPSEERHVWCSRKMPFTGRVLGRVTRPSNQTNASRA